MFNFRMNAGDRSLLNDISNTMRNHRDEEQEQQEYEQARAAKKAQQAQNGAGDHSATPAGLSEFEDAQRRAAERRAAIQAMLDEASRVEAQLAAEVTNARSAAEQANLEKKMAAVASAVQGERQAAARVEELQRLVGQASASHTEAEAAQRAANDALASISAVVVQCEARLREVKALEGDAIQAAAASKQRLDRAADISKTAKADADRAMVELNTIRQDREQAQSCAREAQEALVRLSPSSTVMAELQELEKRSALRDR